MTVGIQDHIHIDTVATPVAEYPSLQGSWNNIPRATIAIDYALNGIVHVHRLLDDASAIILYEDTVLEMLCTLAQMLTLRLLVGSTVYFVSNYHDDNENGAGSLKAFPLSDYVVRGAFNIDQNIAIDPPCTYWRMAIRIIDIQEDPA